LSARAQRAMVVLVAQRRSCMRSCALFELALLLSGSGLLYARGASADTVLAFKYTPAPRVQIAIWIEDAAGRHLATVALTEAVAFRGIGNRPGASQMNSGYRWPYGRREGVLPIWAHRRASAPAARRFPRVIFQSRIEGLASQSTQDQSADRYYCLQFDSSKSTRDHLDAISCATAFNSDKGRYLTSDDLVQGYAEPWQDPAANGGIGDGREQPLSLESLYPPRMDVTRCGTTGTCFDHADVDRYAADARAVMPEIDAVTIATPPGDSQQSLLFTVPSSWPAGDYVAWIEVNLEGDYNERWNDTRYPTPQNPDTDWDYYAKSYGYAYRGQPSLVWKVPFSLGTAHSPSEANFATDAPAGRSSWDVWSASYGELEPLNFDPADSQFITNAAPGTGADRLRRDATGQRFVVQTKSVVGVPQPAAPDAGTNPMLGSDAAAAPNPTDAAASPNPADAAAADAGMALPDPIDPSDTVGPVLDLSLLTHPNRLRAHTWVLLRLRAVRSSVPLHAYEVRVATEPIVDEGSFIRAGRQAKNATDDAEGATLLSLPTDVPMGALIEAAIGDLVSDTHYYVGVRATDELNRHGPISVAEITTSQRRFATVSPCFVATAAYGSPLAVQVGVLRHLRDRYLLPSALGRVWVAGYYALGAPLASWIAAHAIARAAARVVLWPLVGFAGCLP
jgi:hypothetical protein